MKKDAHTISRALPNIKGPTLCRGYLFVFWTEISKITIILFFDLINHYLTKMKCERMVLKSNLHQFVDIWQYHKLNQVFNLYSTLTIILCNRGVRRHILHKLLSPLQELNNIFFNENLGMKDHGIPCLLFSR